MQDFMGVSNMALRGGKTLRLLDWIEAGLKDRVASLEQGFASKREAYLKLQKEVDANAEANVEDRLQGIEIPEGERRKMFLDTRQILWDNNGGKRVYAEFKSAESATAPAAQATQNLLGEIAKRREELKQPAAVQEAEEVLRILAAKTPDKDAPASQGQ
ncbi:MAG: hypothetical protein Q7R55_00065 [Candidatus Wildermuthbacteria bacterium]|nr:hypothetical protein [Candidatus Wildermuthbacteria bacterium]